MISPDRRPPGVWFALAVLLGFALLAGPASPARGQQSLPADVAAAIEEAMRAGETAAANAAFSAAIADLSKRDEIVARTRLHVTRSSIANAVVEGIARHPQAVSAIVAAAVRRAPAHRDVIVRRAILAFPSFAAQITAAAGVPPPAPVIMPQSNLVPASVYGAPLAPSYGQPLTPSYPVPAYPVPAYPGPAYTGPVQVAQAAEPLPQPRPSQTLADMLSLSEVRLGIAHHDTGVFGHNKEDAVDIALGVRFQPLGGEVWDVVANPRPFLGLNFNTAGDTSSLNGGLNWDWDVWNQTFFSFAWGGALHNGKLSTNNPGRKELGSRVLFYLAAELGYRFDRRQSVVIRLDHMSNAGLTNDNEGLDTVGLVYSYHF
jgi:lipid A 3-O-deacylase